MSNNSSEGSNGTSWDLPQEYIIGFTVAVSFDVIFVTVGVFINTWLMASILTGPDLRGKLRNQIICSISILFIIDDLFVSFFEITWNLSFLKGWRVFMSCKIFEYYQMMIVLVSIVADFLIALLACVFLAQVLDFDPASKLRPQHVRIGRATVLLSPWVFAVIAGPPSVSSISIHLERYGCSFIRWRQFYILESVYTILPLSVAIVITSVAVVLRCTRFGKGRLTAQGNMGVQLMGSGPEIDSPLAYIGAVLVAAACEVCLLVIYFNINRRVYSGIFFAISSGMLDASRCILQPPVFLFFTDIRQRIKAWRPWRPAAPASGIDLTIAYTKES